MNAHIPAVALGIQSNTDGSPVLTRNGSEMYCCKYCSKHSKRLGTRAVLCDVLDDMTRKDASAREAYGDTFEESKLGSKLHRAFMAEVGEEMSQTEAAHRANRCPEYFCSRPARYAHLYKQALALSTVRQAAWATSWDEGDGGGDWAEDGRKLATRQSDLELYERRSTFAFPQGTELSERLPSRATPEEQVAAASLFEFFWLVQYHGGQEPYLTWHDPLTRPIVIVSPVVKLREGPDFSFGARWALVQYHV